MLPVSEACGPTQLAVGSHGRSGSDRVYIAMDELLYGLFLGKQRVGMRLAGLVALHYPLVAAIWCSVKLLYK